MQVWWLIIYSFIFSIRDYGLNNGDGISLPWNKEGLSRPWEAPIQDTIFKKSTGTTRRQLVIIKFNFLIRSYSIRFLVFEEVFGIQMVKLWVHFYWEIDFNCLFNIKVMSPFSLRFEKHSNCAWSLPPSPVDYVKCG